MLIVEANRGVRDLVTKCVCLGCVRAKSCCLSVEVVHNHRVQSNDRQAKIIKRQSTRFAINYA